MRQSEHDSFALPHAPRVEASVLASCLIKKQYWPLLASLDPDPTNLFYEPNHRTIANAMNRLHQARRQVTEEMVEDVLRQTKEELDGGVREYLLALAMRAGARDESEFRDSVTELGQQRSLRRIATDSAKLSERARSGEETPQELARDVLTIAEHGRSTDRPIMTLGEKMRNRDNSVASWRVSTGFRSIDDLIAGWEAGRLYVIAARPKVGKSALTINTATHALDQGAAVAFVSYEMSASEIYSRVLSSVAVADYSTVSRYVEREVGIEAFPEETRADVLAAQKSVDELDSMYLIEVGDTPGGLYDVLASVTEIKSRLKPEQPLVVVVDYVQLLVRDARDQVSEITNITRELKLLAKRLNVPVIALSQLNRDAAGVGMPSAHQMRGSGSLEQDADAVILMHRECMDNPEYPEHELQVRVDRSRYSRTGSVELAYYVESQVITDSVAATVGEGVYGGPVKDERREPSRNRGDRESGGDRSRQVDDAPPWETADDIDVDADAARFGI